MEENKTIQQVQVAVPQLTKREFLELIPQKMGNYKWTKEIIEYLNPDNTKLVYVWGNRFKGKVEGTWSAKTVGDGEIALEDEVISVKANIPDGTHYSSNLPNMDFDLLVVNDNEATPQWAKQFCKVGFIGDNFQPYTFVEASEGVINGSEAGNPHSAWMKNGNTIIDTLMLPIAMDLAKTTAVAYVALDIVPAEYIQKNFDMFNTKDFECRDVTVSSRNSVLENPTPVLIPFYVLEFKHKETTCYMAMMADCRQPFNAHMPSTNKLSKTPEQIVAEEMPDKVKQAKILKWGWVLAILLLFSAGFKIAFVYLIVWGAGYWFFNKAIKDRIKAIESEVAENEQKLAEQLKKQLLK